MLACVYLVSETQPSSVSTAQFDFGLARLAAEFPSIQFLRASRCPSDAIVVHVRLWQTASTFCPFDWIMGELDRPEPQAIAVYGEYGESSDLPGVALELVTRYQRYALRRNPASSSEPFSRVLCEIRWARDSARNWAKAVVQSDVDHAIDTWQWLIRLSPCSGIAVQVASLLRDTDLRGRNDRRAGDERALFTAALATPQLRAFGFDDSTSDRIRALCTNRERVSEDRDLAALNDASALSFFSLNSARYLDSFGEAQTKKHLLHSYNRLRPAERYRLSELRLRPDIASLFFAMLRARDQKHVVRFTKESARCTS